MLKRIALFLTALLVTVAFVFTAFPRGLSLLIHQFRGEVPGLLFRPPAFEEKPSFYYGYFIQNHVEVFEVQLETFMSLVQEKSQGVSVQEELNLLEIAATDLAAEPRYREPDFDPLYGTFHEMQEELRASIALVIEREDRPLSRQDIDTLRMRHSRIESLRSTLYEDTVRVLNQNGILYFVEEDYRITIYD